MRYDSTLSILIAILAKITGNTNIDRHKYDSCYSILLDILDNMGVAPDEAQQIILNLAAEVTEIEPEEGETVEEGVTMVSVDLPAESASVDNNGVLNITN